MHLLFSIANATVKLFNNTVFADLNFSINQGEHWAIAGESGSGKSALLQTIAGNLNAVGGTVYYRFFEEYIQQHPEQRGYVTHHKLMALVEPRHHFRNLSNTTEFYYQQRYNSSDSEDALTVIEYLDTIKPLTGGNSYWTLDKITSVLKLESLKEKQLIKLSNGEGKRLRIAAALMKNPVLLLLDSPLTGLDVETRQEFNAIISAIAASGITIIMATSPYELPDIITHVALLKNGGVSWRGPKQQFKTQLAALPQASGIDKAEIKALLNLTAADTYQQVVRMKDVRIKYGHNVVLDNINWDVKQGDKWALLGHNGAGKSTLLSLVNGDNPQAYANDIILFDRKRGSGESIWDIKKKTGFVSPELHQYFPVDNSCLQVIESGYYDTLGLFRQSNPKRAEIALRWMKALEIDKYARVLLKNIPASAQRLCLLARALIKNPPLLIFDEPCQGMDEHQVQHFKTLVDTICSLSNVTLIYVTHYQHEIPDSVDKVLKLEKGKVV